MFMSTRNCPACGRTVEANVSFCPFCGAKIDNPFQNVNTHSLGWAVMSFLVSFLWFKINNVPLFPLGFFGGLIIAFWSYDTDKALRKESYLWLSIPLSAFGMVIGLFMFLI
jgi:hypothetical protein